MNNPKIEIFDFRPPNEKFPLFEIKNFRQTPPPANIHLPHRHTYYEIHYVIQGKGSHMIDFKSYELQPHSLYFISPGQVHLIKRKSPILAKVILFAEDFNLLFQYNHNILTELSFFHSIEDFPHLVLDKDQIPIIDKTIQEIENEYRSDRFGKTSLVASSMNILLIHIQRFYEDAHKSKTHPKSAQIVRRFKQAISHSISSEHSVESYAQSIGVSPGHLRVTVKEVTGLTPGEMIRNRLVIEAKRLLLYTEMTIAEIGYALSFEDPSYFGRFFKRETNQSPKQFRQSIQAR